MAKNTQRIALSTVVQILGRIFTSAIGIVTVGITTRYLGLHEYGQLTTVTIFLSLFATLTDVGTNNLAIRELAQKPDQARKILGNVLMLRFGASIVSALLAILAAQLVYPHAGNANIRFGVMVLASTLLLTAVQTSLTSILSANIKNYLIVVGDTLNKLLVVALLIYVAAHDLGYNGVVYAYLGGALISFLSDCFFALRECRPSFNIDLKYMRYLLILALPFGAAVILNTLYFRIDGILLSLFKGSDEVGLYGAAYKIVELTMSFPIFFMMAVFPLMAAAANEKERLAQITRRAVHYLSLMAAPIVLGVIVLSPEAIILIGGQEFAQAWLPLSLLMVGNYFVYQSTTYGNFLLATNRQNIILRVTATTLVFNVIINLILIPLAGASGAATAVLLAEMLQFVILLTYYVRHMHIQESLAERFIPLLNGAVMAAAVYASKLYFEHLHLKNVVVLLGGIAVGAIVYGLLVLATKQLRLNDLKEMLGRA